MLVHSGSTDQSAIHSILLSISKKLSLLSNKDYFEPPMISFRSQMLEVEKDNLKEIFRFLAKQHIVVGKYTTFERLVEQQDEWSCGVFIKFLHMFGIYSYTKKSAKVMQRQTTIKIFKDHSVLNKYMNFSLFMKALDMIAQEYFTKEYDNVVKLDVSSLDAPRKKHYCLRN